nr:probable RNA-dependent RNA polymerase 5 [Tanacetum cinerariifolium]
MVPKFDSNIRYYPVRVLVGPLMAMLMSDVLLCFQIRRKLEDVVSVQDAIDIISMKTGPMFDFEAKISAKYGRANCEPSDRVMVEARILCFKQSLHFAAFGLGFWKDVSLSCYGPFVNTRRTYLQRELGDANVLIVQITDHLDPDMPFDQQSWIAARQTISDRI